MAIMLMAYLQPGDHGCRSLQTAWRDVAGDSVSYLDVRRLWAVFVFEHIEDIVALLFVHQRDIGIESRSWASVVWRLTHIHHTLESTSHFGIHRVRCGQHFCGADAWLTTVAGCCWAFSWSFFFLRCLRIFSPRLLHRRHGLIIDVDNRNMYNICIDPAVFEGLQYTPDVGNEWSHVFYHGAFCKTTHACSV